MRPARILRNQLVIPILTDGGNLQILGGEEALQPLAALRWSLKRGIIPGQLQVRMVTKIHQLHEALVPGEVKTKAGPKPPPLGKLGHHPGWSVKVSQTQTHPVWETNQLQREL